MTVEDVQEWDGKPKVVLSWDHMAELYALVPQWHGVAVGPVIPFSEGKVARVEVNCIFRTTREEALEAMEYNIRHSCATESMSYDEEQWEVTHLVLLNGC